MTPPSYALFETPIGMCAVAWRGPVALVGSALPGADPDALRARLRRRWPAAVEVGAPAAVRRAIERVCDLLRGGADDLLDIELDMSAVPDFDRRVFAIARRIAPGTTRTYGEIAAALGEPDAARAVGRALGANPFPIVVPCHRVLAAGGRPGGFSAPGGTRTKLRLLEIEGAALGGTPGLFDRAR
jgi:methylated-DNA-[protein]-cysteine S-methyltransferase